MPAMVENCRSSGVATVDAMVSGLAPGSAAATHRMVGIVHAGQRGYRQGAKRHHAEQDDGQEQHDETPSLKKKQQKKKKKKKKKKKYNVLPSVNGVNAKPVKMKIAKPHQCVVAKKAPHFIRSRIFKIHRAAPWRVMRLDRVRPKLAGVISARSKVVVNHIQQHSQALFMRGIDKSLQSIRSTVRLMNRVERHAVVAPSMPPIERRNRHQFHMSNPKPCQVIEPRNRCIKRAFGRKRSNVQLVNNRARQREPPETPHRSTRIARGHKRAKVRALHLAATENADRDTPSHRRPLENRSRFRRQRFQHRAATSRLHPARSLGSRRCPFSAPRVLQRVPKFQIDASFTPASFTSSATGKRRNKFCARTFSPFMTSPVNKFVQFPAGSSTVVRTKRSSQLEVPSRSKHRHPFTSSKRDQMRLL